MSRELNGQQLGAAIEAAVSGAVVRSTAEAVWIKPESVLEVARFVKDDPELRFDQLCSLTAVDYIDHFELVYRFRSLPHNTTAVIKAKLGFTRDDLEVDSVYDVWRGADLLERETWDLLGIQFRGHPNLKRLMLWEGFPGHPLRKDFLSYDQSVVPVEHHDD